MSSPSLKRKAEASCPGEPDDDIARKRGTPTKEKTVDDALNAKNFLNQAIDSMYDVVKVERQRADTLEGCVASYQEAVDTWKDCTEKTERRLYTETTRADKEQERADKERKSADELRELLHFARIETLDEKRRADSALELAATASTADHRQSKVSVLNSEIALLTQNLNDQEKECKEQALARDELNHICEKQVEEYQDLKEEYEKQAKELKRLEKKVAKHDARFRELKDALKKGAAAVSEASDAYSKALALTEKKKA
ncbi:uncharacterized protein K452DRAFT_314102 [Aplosporella prunicola CBS 121167]|uniref:Uncharacterized protein n=1 Tax=Aplosporella prunicola CBS 121167 TaxID=1176127 RepID=A0A6A6AVP6_9PEZI|nr:uncharacterized protein K452DRAFT_314102 [Aplosporella prunicola CBS 121167]KAF2135298.1 hypothetical protein K452DRAFT_314102 [Aplosporella prunicola CBS 121167]